MNQAVSDSELMVKAENGTGLIVLNRPRALNALSAGMIGGISAALRAWEKDPAVKVVVFKGAGERAFCAGGDMKAVYLAHQDGKIPAEYFQEEYRLNRRIFHYLKPTIAYMNGITMGGGYGIAGNCRHRIASEKTVFAMPETTIGFFPDVGSMAHLTKAPRQFGRYLALTGAHIGAGDVMAAGLADHFIPSENEEDILNVLDEDPVFEKPAAEIFATHSKKIEKIFAHKNLDLIFKALRNDASDWSRETLSILDKNSPISLAVTNEYYNRAVSQKFDRIIETDFILAQKFLRKEDLFEGVRARLIDRGQTPRWSPASLESMDNQQIEAYFAPTNLSL